MKEKENVVSAGLELGNPGIESERATTHYGRFRENLSQNSRGYIFSLIWHCLVPLALWDIENLLKTKKGQQRS